VKNWLINTFYNLDRFVASLFGAPPEETISSEIGRHDKNPVVEEAEDVLDAVQKGHTQNAVSHADALDKADTDYYASGRKGI
jgi:hypothetical protein